MNTSSITEYPDYSVVYFIQRKTDKRIKIGYSASLKDRFSSLSIGGKMKLLGYIQGGSIKESELHRMFSDYREEREWFYPAPEIYAYIRENCEVSFLTVRRKRAEVQEKPVVSIVKIVEETRFPYTLSAQSLFDVTRIGKRLISDGKAGLGSQAHVNVERVIEYLIREASKSPLSKREIAESERWKRVHAKRGKIT